MHQIIKLNEENIKMLCEKHNVKSLFAFGSITRGSFNDESDIDLLVSFHPMTPEEYADNYFDLVESFEILLSRPVDLVTEKSLRNPYFIESVNNSKARIYEA